MGGVRDMEGIASEKRSRAKEESSPDHITTSRKRNER